MKLLKHLIFAVFLLFSFNSFSEDIKDKLSYAESLNGKNDNEMYSIADSILNIINKSDTNFEEYFYKASYLKARVLNRRGDLENALDILNRAINHNPNALHNVYYGNLFLLKGIIYKKKADPNKTITNYSRSIQIFEEIQNCKAIIKGRNNLANYYNSISNYDQSIEQYKICLNLLNQCPNPYQKAIINRNLAGLYYNFDKESNKGIKHFKEALNQFSRLEPTKKIENLIIGVLNELTFLFLQNKNFIEAQNYSHQSGNLIDKETPIYLAYNYKLNLAKLKIVNGKHEEGSHDLFKLEELINENKSLNNYKTGLYIVITEYYQNKKSFNKALDYINKAETLAIEQNKIEIIANTNLIKSKILEELSQFEKANKSLKKYLDLKDQIFNEKNSKILQNNKFQIENIKKENIYKLEKLEHQEEINNRIILQNKLENEKLKISIGAISVTILLLTILFWFYSQRKKSSINKLILESKNKALEIELNQKNQEEDFKLFQNTMLAKKEEQKRISRNLHDNIGANLAAIKLALDGEKDQAFNDLIDDVYQEVRNLSYELSESKDLFKQMISTYLKNIEKASGIKILFEVYPDLEIESLYSVKKREIFSIIREVVQNAIKHSDSPRMEIIFTQEEDQLHIYIEDFGKGFEINEVELGLGLTNIKKRVTLLNGDFDLDARVGRGVIININIPV